VAVVSRVDVTLSNGVDAVLEGGTHIIGVSGQLLDQVVVASELIVQH